MSLNLLQHLRARPGRQSLYRYEDIIAMAFFTQRRDGHDVFGLFRLSEEAFAAEKSPQHHRTAKVMEGLEVYVEGLPANTQALPPLPPRVSSVYALRRDFEAGEDYISRHERLAPQLGNFSTRHLLKGFIHLFSLQVDPELCPEALPLFYEIHGQNS